MLAIMATVCWQYLPRDAGSNGHGTSAADEDATSTLMVDAADTL